MGWFEEQIIQRSQADDRAVEESCNRIAEAVAGSRFASLLSDKSVAADAIGEILDHYHIAASDVPEDIGDTNETLEYLMRPHGIMRRTVRLDKGWYRDAVGAMLGTRRDDGSVIALIPGTFGGYRFFDRKAGKTVRVSRVNEDVIGTEAIAFYKPFPLTKMTMGSFVKYLTEQISVSDITVLCIATFVVSLVGLLVPHINKLLLGDVLKSGNTTALIGAGIYLLCASIGMLLFGVVRSLVNSRIGTKLSINVEAASMMRLLSLPADFFRDYSSGELSNRLQYVEQLAGQIVDMVLSTTLSSLFSLIYSFITNLFPIMKLPSWRHLGCHQPKLRDRRCIWQHC